MQHWFRLITLLAVGFVPATLYGHGGVVLEDDICLIKVGFYEAHFTVFQPRSSGHEQFCEDLPDLGETVFVLEYVHDGLERLAVDMRIIRNVTGVGQFADSGDIEAIDDIDAVTVFYQPALTDPDAFAAIHEFDSAGEFIGIVTAQSEDGNALYTAVFPFEVDVAGFGDTAGLGILIVAVCLALVAIGAWWRRGRMLPSAAVLLGLVLAGGAPSSRADVYEVSGETFKLSVETSLPSIAINRMHSWKVRVRNLDGTNVEDARIRLLGGMPEHDHGLPSAPLMTGRMADGRYLIEGIRFHMGGYWQIELTVETNDLVETLTLHLDL